MKGAREIHLAVVAVVVACVLAPAPLAGQAPRSRVRSFPPDAWITLGDFRHVTSVAVTSDAAYFGTTAGVERFDTLRDRWLAPVTEADGLPDVAVTALAAEPTGGPVWIGTRRGLARLDDLSGEIDRVWGPPPTRVSELRIDLRDGTVYAFVGGEWWVGRAGGPTLERSPEGPPPGARGAVAVEDFDPFDLPWTDPLYVRSGSAEVFRLTVLDRDARGDWYVGTWGDNGRRWGAGRQTWEELYFGLSGPGGGPIVRAAGGIWFLNGSAFPSGAPRVQLGAAASGTVRAAAAAGSGARDGLAFASDTGEWFYVVPDETPGLPVTAAGAALALEDTLYFGSDHGLTRVVARLRTGDRAPPGGAFEWAATTWGWREIGPTGPVSALAVDGACLWLGTPDGLVLWNRPAESATGRYLDGLAVTAILPTDGALFVGTESGLYVGPRPAGVVATPPDSFGRARTLGGEVHALAAWDGVILVATDAGFEAFDRRSGEWKVTRADGGRLPDAPLALTTDTEQVWIGTLKGLVRWRPATNEWETFGPEDGLAGAPVLHLLALSGAVWASTPEGASRFAWDAER